MRGLFLAVFALLIVAGDSGRYVPQLLKNSATAQQFSSSNAVNQNSVFSLLWYAGADGSAVAQNTLVKQFESAHQLQFPDYEDAIAIYWLEKLVNDGNADAAWLLYQMLGEEEASRSLMRLAALGNVAEAQLAFAMSTNEPKKREKWLISAAEQDYLPAQAALADWYMLHGKQQLAKPLLVATADLDMQSAYKYARLLWDEGNTELAKTYFEKAVSQGHEQAKQAIHTLELYSPVSSNSIGAYNWLHKRADKYCLQRIQPFATSLATIIRAHHLYESFNKDLRLASLPLCIAPPVWLEENSLKCEPNFAGAGVLGCDVKQLSALAKKREFSHAVVVAEQGKANVQNGVMYLDISDSYSVFVHELAHFSGFVDEYPIGRTMATRLCNSSDINDFTPPNLIVDSAYWYSPHSTVANWLEIDPATIIAPAKTCAIIGKDSYKPSRRITFMEHHDSGVIPPLHLVLWEQQLMKQEAQRPISMNLFQAFHKQGNREEAAFWLAKYEAFIGD